jgi:hypothetical protein
MFLLSGEKLVEMREQAYDSEDLLQRWLAKYGTQVAVSSEQGASTRADTRSTRRLKHGALRRAWCLKATRPVNCRGLGSGGLGLGDNAGRFECYTALMNHSWKQ